MDRSVDSSEVDQFRAPCLRRDAVTSHFKEVSRKAPQCWHANKPKFSQKKAMWSHGKGIRLILRHSRRQNCGQEAEVRGGRFWPLLKGACTIGSPLPARLGRSGSPSLSSFRQTSRRQPLWVAASHGRWSQMTPTRPFPNLRGNSPQDQVLQPASPLPPAQLR